MFGKGAKFTVKPKGKADETMLLLTSKNRHALRFLTAKVETYAGHWNSNGVLEKCKDNNCRYCKTGVKPYYFHVTPVIDRSDEKIKWLRMTSTFLRQLAELEQKDQRFKKFYSKKYGRDIIIIVKKSTGKFGNRYEYNIYPGDPTVVKSKRLKEIPEFNW